MLKLSLHIYEDFPKGKGREKEEFYMKNMKQLTKCLFAAVSLCIVMTFSLTAQAAVYKPNQVYVDPAEV